MDPAADGAIHGGVTCVPILDNSVDLPVNVLHDVSFSLCARVSLEVGGLCYYFPYFHVEESCGVCGVYAKRGVCSSSRAGDCDDVFVSWNQASVCGHHGDFDAHFGSFSQASENVGH